ncbi:50S ribosomal protein L32 [Candidatus Daviesbacteria bacterium RIFCSPLOWO2_01_FULL_43_38]|uniref:Large ribosomal subunit protein bL32 n=1 Tax=Candidatus Daviesbacteria bacterium RIFCSPHIGHO2_12_FULL_43_11 TaxID=1797780 RepID=A0A1F5K278_9BACT|nr:MAG: 50S ribosomal protein L32 [Candidatus Daviesbacteria bacterium RIFCSPHIGHO2_01_FULL_43_17]OGE35003.1 MAG: 50S ribosomal protein L32 [Candidatus Daviesbacteria bacterium RIFCSPHIGHO2_12_FULL_43_11]OGE63271.1 MAG: 50S ribosomal protein L32 [Candidatus Daviesbacteria bacterium RIFCSPLOWO2_01_FULL_43_38]OGE69029.1 MAG: 50S ribosomal protein L32 [Candidatus Daviesbacteria bacterium RIFCSPLOWO2_02_FULL_43_11]
MPQEPKKRHSKASKRTRRASITLKSVGLVKCSNCQKMKVPHQVCKKCGFFDNKKILEKSKAVVTKA